MAELESDTSAVVAETIPYSESQSKAELIQVTPSPTLSNRGARSFSGVPMEVSFSMETIYPLNFLQYTLTTSTVGYLSQYAPLTLATAFWPFSKLYRFFSFEVKITFYQTSNINQQGAILFASMKYTIVNGTLFYAPQVDNWETGTQAPHEIMEIGTDQAITAILPFVTPNDCISVDHPHAFDDAPCLHLFPMTPLQTTSAGGNHVTIRPYIQLININVGAPVQYVYDINFPA